MECPECGSIGIKFIAGDSALERWKTRQAELTAITYATDDASAGANDRPGSETKEAYREARSPPDDVPEDADVVFCPDVTACGWVAYVERIQWEKVDKQGVSFDD
jgi:hypothetical protein